MEVCKRGLSCEHVIDSLHQDKKRHACIYGATCRIVESDTSGLHAQRFVHDAPITSAREVCKARANCAQLANRSHLLSHLHECARGVECVQVDPQHHFYFSHGGEVRPRVLCQTARCPLVNDAAHTALFMHVCSWGSRCNKQSQAAHVLRFMHPREYCPDRLSCTLIDVDQSHRSAFRHVCPAFGDCAKIKDPMHALRFAHPTLTSLPPCPQGSLCDKNRPESEHNWEFTHPCKVPSCTNEDLIHKQTFTHEVPSLMQIDGFISKLPPELAASGEQKYELMPINQASTEAKFILDRFVNTLGKAYTLRRIERVCNPFLLKLYVGNRNKMAADRGGKANEQLMFHGSQSWKEILTNGFDFRYSRNGRYGCGAYFAFNSRYSDSGYVGQDENGFKTMFVSYVVAGVSTQCAPNSALTEPPNGADSVIEPNTMVIVYKEFRAYPAYLIRYTA